ncbi:MAG: HAD hydrolase-like protein, partial [Anaerolineales bacterium]
MQLNGVIFDLDGTLGNTVPVSVEAIVRAVRAFTGETYTHPEIIARFGPTEQGILRQLVPEEDWEASYRRFLLEYEALHREGGYGVFAGIPEVLDMLHTCQVPTAIVTGKGLDSARISLRYFGLKDAFDVVKAGSLETTVK